MIVDPDLHAVDARVAADATPPLHGAHLDPATLRSVYQTAAADLLAKAHQLPR